jgi:hypothetical protein
MQEQLPLPLRQTILRLASQEDIHSIYCPFIDTELWRSLLLEQTTRATKAGTPPQQALTLIGPDSGIPGITPERYYEDELAHKQQGLLIESSGEIHIPYEGACGADLFIVPTWHKFFADNLKKPNAKLRWAIGKHCNYLLVNCDHGEFSCATRTPIVNNWVQYKSNDHYVRYNPFTE